MLASGTGTDTMRALLSSWTPYIGSPNGLVWLFLGVESWDIVEAGDWQQIQEGHPDKFRFTAAQHREMASGRESARFLENKPESYRYEVFDRLHAGAHIFVIGHSGMLTGMIDCALERVAYEKGINYKESMSELKVHGRWRAELDT